MKSFLLLLICIVMPLNVNSQANDTEAFLYNISISGTFAVIGSIINKRPNEKINEVILKGASQGALGGMITFSSKCLLRETERKENWNYVWAAKIINATGISIIENASLNKNFWEKWHINIGFNRIELETKDKFKINYKLMPVSLVYVIGVSSQSHFDFKKTIKTGELIFLSNSSKFKETNSIAATFPGCIVVKNNFNDKYINEYSLITHEIIHIYQSNSFSVLNTYFQKPLDKISEKSKVVKFINKHIYFDLHYLPLKLAYVKETKSALKYYDNFFEHEAGYFSNTLK